MSSDKFQRKGSNSKSFSFGLRRRDTNKQPIEKQSSITGVPKKIPFRPAIGSDVSNSSFIPVSFAVEKNKPTQQRAEAIQNIAEPSPKRRPISRPLYDEPYASDVSDDSHSTLIPVSFAIVKSKPKYQRAESSPQTRPTSRQSCDGPYTCDLIDASHSERIPVSFAMEKSNKPIYQKAESFPNITESLPQTRPTSRHSYDGSYPSDHVDVSYSVGIPVSFAMEKRKPIYQKAESFQNIVELSPKRRPTRWHSYDGPYPSDHVDVSHSVGNPVSFAMEKSKPIHQRAESFQNVAESSSQTRSTSRHSYDRPCHSDLSDVSHSKGIPVSFTMEKSKPIHQRAISSPKSRQLPRHYHDDKYPSELLPPETKTGVFSNNTSKPKQKASNQNRVPPFKEFTLKLSDLPLTKEKIAKSLSLAKACGFLPYLMALGRDHLTIMERNLDQLSIEMQTAARDARNICFLLENAPVDRPEDINTAKVQAEKLMHLIITSYRIYIKLAKSGRAMKEGLDKYKKDVNDIETSLDNLLELIFRTVLKKFCR